VAETTTSESTQATILNQIEALRNEFYNRQVALPPPTSSLQCAYEIRMQRLYDILDGPAGASPGGIDNDPPLDLPEQQICE
jgi:hypothetical protein